MVNKVGLAHEAAFLHQLLFGCPVSDTIREQYVHAEQKFSLQSGQGCEGRVRLLDLMEKSVDVEAVELYLRVRKRPSEITRKMATLFFLCEVKSDHLAFYVSFSDVSIHWAGLALSRSLLRTLWKYLIGGVLVRVYRLV